VSIKVWSATSLAMFLISKAIVQHLSVPYIQFPNVDEAMRSMEFWREKSHIPGVVGCLDGTHIRILQPAHTGTAYCNRHGYYSINVQGNAAVPQVSVLIISRCRPQKALY
jgi:hypothetical protein